MLLISNISSDFRSDIKWMKVTLGFKNRLSEAHRIKCPLFLFSQLYSKMQKSTETSNSVPQNISDTLIFKANLILSIWLGDYGSLNGIQSKIRCNIRNQCPQKTFMLITFFKFLSRVDFIHLKNEILISEFKAGLKEKLKTIFEINDQKSPTSILRSMFKV